MQELVPGPVAMVGQSGTTTPGIARTLMERGIDVSYVVTSGNETGLITADYIRYFVTDPEVRLIFCLVEAVRRADDFLAACRVARDAGKPVVVLKMGVSEGGRRAALSHTGSLAGRVEAFDAVAGPAGVIRVESADGAVNVIDMLLHASEPRGENVGGLVYSGGVRGLAEDAADRHRVPLPEFAPETRARLRELLGEAQPISNPLDGNGYLTNRPLEDALEVVDAVYNDPGVDMVVMQEDLPPHEGANDANRRRAARVLATMEAIDKQLLGADRKPFALISPASYDLTEFSRTARSRFPHMACLNEPERAFRAIRAVMDYRRRCREAQTAPSPALPDTVTARVESLRQQAAGATSAFPLTEPESKDLVSRLRVPLDRGRAGGHRARGQGPGRAHRLSGGAEGSCRGPHPQERRRGRASQRRRRGGRGASLPGHRPQRSGPCSGHSPGRMAGGEDGARRARTGAGHATGPRDGRGDHVRRRRRVAGAGKGRGLRTSGDQPRGRRPAHRLHPRRQAPGRIPRPGALTTATPSSMRWWRSGRLAAAAGDVIESLDINPFLVYPKGAGGMALDALAVIGTGSETLMWPHRRR